jgi:two-component system NtrC family sensor kinase
LASVGFLAAGVAHEINNPLGIIAGYGERALRRLDSLGDRAAVELARKSIQVMCDEAFRCKEITDRLLMLARSGDNGRAVVSVDQLAREVIASIGALPRFADRRIVFQAEADTEFHTVGSEGELRQVILNLLVNALDATKSESGQVRLSIQRDAQAIQLCIEDNGDGMSPETLARIFEPFYSEKRGEGRGNGLGLAVVHAIISDHHGAIEAHSDGPGAGSRFVVRLPAASEVAHAACA